MSNIYRLKALRAEILRLSEQLLRARAAMERMGPSTQRQYVKKGEHKGKSYLAYVSPVQSSPDPDRLARQLE
ncbi:MAG: hypothetical protein LBJ12_01070, partial [Oscillospiraceae bacterium]|nr:hypothetical protein [Oscillospiraceae bacterium]